MENWAKVKDIRGNPVRLGTRVRLLKIAEFLRRELPKDEIERLESMIGRIFEVTEVDEYGSPWISASWEQGDDQCALFCRREQEEALLFNLSRLRERASCVA